MTPSTLRWSAMAAAMVYVLAGDTAAGQTVVPPPVDPVSALLSGTPYYVIVGTFLLVMFGKLVPEPYHNEIVKVWTDSYTDMRAQRDEAVGQLRDMAHTTEEAVDAARTVARSIRRT